MKISNQNGYIAISSILVIMLIVTVVGTTSSLLSVNEIQSSLSHKKSEEALHLVEGCVEDALLYLNTNNSLPTTSSLPAGTCSVTLLSQIGNTWSFTVTGSFDSHTKSIQVVADRGSIVEVVSWREI